MARLSSPDKQSFVNSDLVLKVSAKVDRTIWDEDKYDAFLTALCGQREYQRMAILTALRYLLAGEYANLEALARENWDTNPILTQRYYSWDDFKKRLSFPDRLSGTLDLATGTGKSFVMYGIAAIMLAEGVVDRVLLLCPSKTIEQGLTEKFTELATRADLAAVMPYAKWKNPAIRNANQTIEEGFICIENYHATLENVGSSIRSSLRGKGNRTLVLNDETHHVANKVDREAGKWKEFLSDADYGFRFILGLTGTAYLENEYFADVLFRYSLKEALAENFVKKVRYVEDATTRNESERWQIIHNHHAQLRSNLHKHGLLPITILVADDTKTADAVAEDLREFLQGAEGWDKDTASRNVLCVHSKDSAKGDVARLRLVDEPGNKVEWIVSVAMLSEGWDVKRVFGIIPHKEKAFNSKLLIAQVMGRALRVPDNWNWSDGPPLATVWNHAAFAPRIKDLVDEILEQQRGLMARMRVDSAYHFDLHQFEYEIATTREVVAAPSEPMAQYKTGIINISSDAARENVSTTVEQAGTGKRTAFQSEIVRDTYSVEEIAQRLFEACQEHSTVEHNYAAQWPLEKLEKIVRDSLKAVGVEEPTEKVRQQFLKEMGSLRVKTRKMARLSTSEGKFVTLSTRSRRPESVNASQLRNGAAKRVFYTDDSLGTLESDEVRFLNEAIESDNYQIIKIDNPHEFKTPLGIVIADSEPERKFIRGLTAKDNTPHLKAWLKSTSTGFYSVKYVWQKRGVPRQSNFNPDFFIRVSDSLICVVEIKSDAEIAEPSEENRQKLLFAREHFERLNSHLQSQGSIVHYHFNFLTPSQFGQFFTYLREDRVDTFQSDLDSALLSMEH